MTFRKSASIKPVDVVWTFRNYSDGKEVEIRASLNNGRHVDG